MSPKKKTMGQGKTSLIGNLTASMPWLKNKTFVIPALASVLALSVVGAVLAVQATNSPEVSADESNASEEVGFACVSGTPICEEVKSLLLDTDYNEVLANWTRESLIAHLEYKYGRSRIFATEVIDAVKFDWGDGSTYSGGSVAEESTRDGSGDSTSAPRSPSSAPPPVIDTPSLPSGVTAPQDKTSLASAVEHAKLIVQMSIISRRDLIEAMTYLGYSNELSTQAIDSLGVNWGIEAQQQARHSLEYNAFSRYLLLLHLETFGYLEAERVYGVDSLNIDFIEQAKREVDNVLTRQPCADMTVVGINSMYNHLYNVKWFEYEESWSAIESQYDEDDFGWWWLMYPECVVAWDE